jgi:predicted metal-dependent phosphoesterase TrpH
MPTHATERFADLHLHTAASDGRWSSEAVVGAMADMGFAAVAITDHDEVSGIPAALEAGRARGVEVVPGVELSTTLGSKETHVLGYYIDYEAPALHEVLETCREHRRGRMDRMVAKLGELGVPVDLARVKGLAGEGAIGRPHLAQAMVEAGYVASVSAAFDRYLAQGRPAYEEKWKLTPAEACALIRRIGGMPVLAHPMLLRDDTLIEPLIEAGVLGLEAYYSFCPVETTAHYVRLAEAAGLLVTGGSDCHQVPDNMLMGRVRLPYERVEALRARWEALREGL